MTDTFKCNGCGGEFETSRLYGTLSYGAVKADNDGEHARAVFAAHHKTLCPRCKHVLKDILLSSDLSEHWDKYDWENINGSYDKGYEGGE